MSWKCTCESALFVTKLLVRNTPSTLTSGEDSILSDRPIVLGECLRPLLAMGANQSARWYSSTRTTIVSVSTRIYVIHMIVQQILSAF